MRVSPLIAAASKVMLWYANSNSDTMTRTLSDILPPVTENCRRVYLLRHGQTDWNARGMMQGGGFDIELNGIGLHQADLAAEQLCDVPLGVVVSSPLKRAHETAERVHAYHQNAKREVLDSFREMRFGEFEGTITRGPDSTENSRRRVKWAREQMKQDKSFAWPGGGESVSQVEKRAVAGLQKVLKKYSDEDHIAIVAHGRTNRILLSALLESDQQDLLQGNTCINVLDVDRRDGTWTPVLLNYVDHVEGDSMLRTASSSWWDETIRLRMETADLTFVR